MAKFSIDTDKVSVVASDISSLSSTSSSVASSVSGYDTNNDDGFDFSGAKSAIENNVDGMKIKVSNTSVLLDTVVSTHSSLQDSVSDSSGSNSGSDYGSYSYSGGNYSSGGGGYSGGSNNMLYGFGETNPTIAGTGNAAVAQEQLAETASVEEALKAIDLASLDVEDPLANPTVDTALKENPSAYEKLVEELGKVESTVGSAESTLNEELEVVLSSNSIKTTSPEGLIAESFGKALLVIEASTQTPGITKYVKDANDVAKEHKVEVRFLGLDDIVDFSSSSTSYNETIKDEVLTVKNDTPADTKEEKQAEETTEKPTTDNTTEKPVTDHAEETKTEEKVEEKIEEKQEENIIDDDATKEVNGPEEETPASEEEKVVNEEEKANDEQTEDGVPQEVIINEDEKEREEQAAAEAAKDQEQQENVVEKAVTKSQIVMNTTATSTAKAEQQEEPKEEKQEEKKVEETKENKPVASSKIKDQDKYNKLTSIPTRGDVKNDILNSPVTMILKDNLILNAETGILSKERLEILIQSSGISNK